MTPVCLLGGGGFEDEAHVCRCTASAFIHCYPLCAASHRFAQGRFWVPGGFCVAPQFCLFPISAFALFPTRLTPPSLFPRSCAISATVSAGRPHLRAGMVPGRHHDEGRRDGSARARTGREYVPRVAATRLVGLGCAGGLRRKTYGGPVWQLRDSMVWECLGVLGRMCLHSSLTETLCSGQGHGAAAAQALLRGRDQHARPSARADRYGLQGMAWPNDPSVSLENHVLLAHSPLSGARHADS